MEKEKYLELKNIFKSLKIKSEKLWEKEQIKLSYRRKEIVESGTKWKPGINDYLINKFETDLGFKFPEIYKIFLKNMNGTTKSLKIEFKNEIENQIYFYSYPKDINIIKEKIKIICDEFNISIYDIDGIKIPFLIPIFENKYLLVDNKTNPIISISEMDIIIYNSSLEFFLVDEIFDEKESIDSIYNIKRNFWLNKN